MNWSKSLNCLFFSIVSFRVVGVANMSVLSTPPPLPLVLRKGLWGMLSRHCLFFVFFFLFSDRSRCPCWLECFLVVVVLSCLFHTNYLKSSLFKVLYKHFAFDFFRRFEKNMLVFFFLKNASSSRLIVGSISSGIPIDCIVHINCEIMKDFPISIFLQMLKIPFWTIVLLFSS